MVFPSLAVTEAYDDNIFRQNNNEEDDLITFIRPEISLNSLWSRHSLNVTLRGEQTLYADNTDENYTNFSALADGQIDIQRSSNIYVEGSFERLHEERDSPEDVFGEEPTEYDRTRGVLGIVHELNTITLDVQGNVTDLNFKDVDARNAVGEINNDDRDRTIYEAVGEVSFSTSPRYDLFVRGSYNIRDYDAAVDDRGRDRDSEGWRAAGGVDFEISAKTFGNIFAGFQSQDFDGPTLSTVDGLDFGAEVTWNATQLTTFSLAVERAIEETTRQNASSRVRSAVSLSADHELLRNLLVGVDGLYQKEDFEGVNRDDDRFEAGASIDYLWNRHLDASLSYRFSKRASTLDREDFTANVVMLTLEVAL
ncbi:uncharacterized protein, PEP-CTERM system associated [Limimonas halophila]|uniref:Uncharacterized protein, PEP-CTERM system associated n=2 Tax=Limimonas halophila TaxID=1082479 RepID=A0A1G7NU93_9PROT|nr:uncharacterized protein, PEP-CTERM system associated [Limimonas halophila]